MLGVKEVYLLIARSLNSFDLNSLISVQHLVQPIQVFLAHLLMREDSSCLFFHLIEFSGKIQASLKVNSHELDWCPLVCIPCLERDNIDASLKELLNFIAQLYVRCAESLHLMGMNAISLQHREDSSRILFRICHTVRLYDDAVIFSTAVFFWKS